MKTKRAVRARMASPADKEAVVIYNKIDKMLNQGKTPKKIEEWLAAELDKHFKERTAHGRAIFDDGA